VRGPKVTYRCGDSAGRRPGSEDEGEWLARWLGFDGNPLRRRSDRIEARLRLALAVAFVPLAVLAAGSFGHWVGALSRHELSAQPSRQQVAAVLLKAVPDSVVVLGASVPREVPARWNADGRRFVGMVPVLPGTRRGARVMIWVNSAGTIAPAPLTTSNVATRVACATALAVLAVVLALWLMLSLIRGLFNHFRLASWGAAWSTIGPLWTGRG
jgi:hypothetical protein